MYGSVQEWYISTVPNPMCAKYFSQSSFFHEICLFVFSRLVRLSSHFGFCRSGFVPTSAVDGVSVHPDHSEPRLRTLEKREKEFFLFLTEKKAFAPHLEGLPPQNPVLRYVVVLKLETSDTGASFPNPTNQPGTPRPSAWRRSPPRP